MKSPQVSLIIPVYNVEKYLSVCIESVLVQSFTDFELILINDGSTDSSGAMCDFYAMLDNRIRVFHKKNEGVSVARNSGIKEAKAEWILFIDSDDWIDENYVLSFMNLLLSTDHRTLIIQSMQGDNPKYNVGCYDFQDCEGPIKELMLKYDLYVFGSPCCKLFNKEIIIGNDLKFPESYSYGEDTIFYLNYLLYVDHLKIRNSKGYFYRQHSNETLSKKVHPIDQQMLYFAKHFELVQKLIVSKDLNRKFVNRCFSEFYIWGLYKAWISQYQMKYSSCLISRNINLYSDDINNILSRASAKQLKSLLALLVIKNVTFLSRFNFIDKMFRLIYK